jgi:hypothetical protein
MAAFFESLRTRSPLPAYDVAGLSNEEQAVVALFFLGQELKSVMLRANTPRPDDDVQMLWAVGDALTAQIEEILAQFGDRIKETQHFTINVQHDTVDDDRMLVCKVFEG